MNLTYEVTEKGYIILKDGKAWIVQDGYIPYKGATLDESAQLHIDDIIKANIPAEPTPSQEEQLAQLKAEQALMKKAMDDLIFQMGGAL